MGYFSWITSDTKKSLPNVDSGRRPFTAHMISNDGRVFTEKNYRGYGVFGGIDFYALAAEMNGHGHNRDEFFDKCWIRGIKKGDKIYIQRWIGGKNTFARYDDPIPTESGLCANELIKNHGWESFDYGNDFSAHGIVLPKVVQNLPKDLSKESIVAYYNSLPDSESCPDQGYFYGDDEDWDITDYLNDDED